jgi:hypothetical protein
VAAEKEEADTHLWQAVFTIAAAHAAELGEGGTLSLMVIRGKDPDAEATNPAGSFASLVIDNPETDDHRADRHTWEFRVERRSAEMVPIVERRVAREEA